MGTTIDTSLLQSRENYFLLTAYYTNVQVKVFQNLRTLVSEGIAGGYVRPLSRVTYGPDDAPRAFRLLAASRHRGRVLLRLSDPQPQAQSRYFTMFSISLKITNTHKLRNERIKFQNSYSTIICTYLSNT
ncbi:Uncharacterized protein OBRU01_15087 [Operophtera brumata]|uniref:Uncharacterized protein n=1 Tax=Operophtera brumata TaxID=104452 RepID=A0A0L7L5I5_OPEBR|nr:Uncharacterized protein OBRU01_15087 [Operophtera brumata]